MLLRICEIGENWRSMAFVKLRICMYHQTIRYFESKQHLVIKYMYFGTECTISSLVFIPRFIVTCNSVRFVSGSVTSPLYLKNIPSLLMSLARSYRQRRCCKYSFHCNFEIAFCYFSFPTALLRAGIA